MLKGVREPLNSPDPSFISDIAGQSHGGDSTTILCHRHHRFIRFVGSIYATTSNNTGALISYQSVPEPWLLCLVCNGVYGVNCLCQMPRSRHTQPKRKQCNEVRSFTPVSLNVLLYPTKWICQALFTFTIAPLTMRFKDQRVLELAIRPTLGISCYQLLTCGYYCHYFVECGEP